MTFGPIFANICLQAAFRLVFLKDNFKNLLPKRIFKRDALTFKSFKIKPAVSTFRLKRLTNISSRIIFLSLLVIFLSGYYPIPAFPPVKKSAVYAQEPVQRQEIIASSFSEPVILPHPGYLSTRFSTYHPGIDIAIGMGMPIRPINPGVVEDAVYSLFGYGNYVTINHDNGFRSLYAHMGRIFVKKGDKVASVNIIGEVGVTGRTSGPHTHLEVTKNGQYVNPLTILPSLPDMPPSATPSAQAKGKN